MDDSTARDERVDQAAVLGVALAVSVSISAAEGPWEPIETILGLVLMLVIRTYFRSDGLTGDENRVKRVTLAGIVGLCWCLVASWPLQSALLLLKWPSLVIFMPPAVWLVATVLVVRRVRTDSTARHRCYRKLLAKAFQWL